MSERRIEVRTEQAVEFYGFKPRTWDAVMQDAERAGIDLGREFRACVILGWVQFWQEPTPLPDPNDMLPPRPKKKKARKRATPATARPCHP